MLGQSQYSDHKLRHTTASHPPAATPQPLNKPTRPPRHSPGSILAPQATATHLLIERRRLDASNPLSRERRRDTYRWRRRYYPSMCHSSREQPAAPVIRPRVKSPPRGGQPRLGSPRSRPEGVWQCPTRREGHRSVVCAPLRREPLDSKPASTTDLRRPAGCRHRQKPQTHPQKR